jgi:general secretion pathway protein L
MSNEWAVRSPGIEAVAARWQDFCRGWLTGLHETVPQSWLAWIHGETIPRLMIRRDHDSVVCNLIATDISKEMRHSLHDFGLLRLDAWLSECNLTLKQVSVGVAVDRELFFVRNVTLPSAAATALPTILEQDLLRRTPFQVGDVWHGATQGIRGDGEVLTAQHWIIRKDRAGQALTELGLCTNDVDFLAANDADDNCVPVIWYREAMHEDPAWARRAIKLLAITALGTMLLALAAFEYIQFSVSREIATSLSEARELAQASDSRTGINQKAILFAMKSDVSVLEIWNELSKILPDQTFLTESRIADGKVTISGFSNDAAGLVRMIDQSTLFTGAILANGLTPDAAEHKDRFSIILRVRGAQVIPSADQARNE